MGWVSILNIDSLAQTLKVPADVFPVAYLCVGYVDAFRAQPELETEGWRSRLPLHQLVHSNVGGQTLDATALAVLLQQPPELGSDLGA